MVRKNHKKATVTYGYIGVAAILLMPPESKLQRNAFDKLKHHT